MLRLSRTRRLTLIAVAGGSVFGYKADDKSDRIKPIGFRMDAMEYLLHCNLVVAEPDSMTTYRFKTTRLGELLAVKYAALDAACVEVLYRVDKHKTCVTDDKCTIRYYDILSNRGMIQCTDTVSATWECTPFGAKVLDKYYAQHVLRDVEC